ncbi:hypothetical protein PLICRDRAFT_701821 [Plicaturopsis crispa FD-325 SS-3]|uniref:Unplaced genomic scaffold PLICRscaffold_17, whole genome shotgun sequence n=1 Tax=Plicaturopsis crispa FD-325 SS-3 TaxID=944288 RepID=A0A0C9SRH7_PLICR|nr:hypothetical protein PLICRDRAFT_701821 [Plicaturopsis crispa FD-325 SS-3]
MSAALRPPLQTSSSPRDGEPDPSDLQKLRDWQEQRIARKLRGEYESAVLQLAELVNDNLQTPLRVGAVRVEGAHHTRRSFLNSLIHPLLPPDASTLESVLHTSRRISHVLNKTDIFQTLEAKIEKSRDVLAQDGNVDIVFKAREKGRLYLKTSTEFGNAEGNASVTGRVRNVFGGAESFEANMAFGTKTRRALHAVLSAPLTSTLDTTGEISVFGTERDNTSYASSSEGLRGLRAVIRTGALRGGAHEFAYEAALRHVGGLTPTASLSMRAAAGQTSKSALSHTWTRDTRDDRHTATRGMYTKLFQQFAGLGGDASFYKAEAEGQISRPLFSGVSVSLGARSGLLWSIGRPSLFPDRFQLGGPVSIRSFRANSLGPRDGVDSVGGELYWSAGLSVISNIPRKPHWPIKTHAYINAGRLDTLDKSRTLADNVADCLSRPSVSAGVGLIYRFDPVRVELNFGVPLVASKSDGGRRGFQLGMGLDFL